MSKVVTIPLAPRTARAIDLATGERTGGPVFLAADGRRLDRHGAARIVRRITRRAGIAKTSAHTRCGTPSSLPHLMPGFRSVMCRKPHPMRIRAPPCDMTVHGPAWTGMPLTSSLPTSPGQPDRSDGEHGRRSWPRSPHPGAQHDRRQRSRTASIWALALSPAWSPGSRQNRVICAFMRMAATVG